MSVDSKQPGLADNVLSEEALDRPDLEVPIEETSIEEIDDYNPADDYRALSTPAVAGLALGVLSPLALLDWWLGLIPLAAIVLCIIGLRQVVRFRTEYTGLGLAIVGLVAAVLFWGAGVGRLGYIYATEVPEGYERISYADLQPHKGDPPNSLPPEAVSLDGKKVFIKGYVYPGNRKTGITQCLVVRDQGDCCFGGNPKITDRIQVMLSDSKGFTFGPNLFKVAGTLRIQPIAGAVDADGLVFYHLDGAMLR